MMTYVEQKQLEGRLEGRLEDFKNAIINQFPKNVIDYFKDDLAKLGFDEEDIERIQKEAEVQKSDQIYNNSQWKGKHDPSL